jgi:type III pantothenate kinase
MNLIIDVGNTFVKLAVFKKNTIQIKKTCLKKDFLKTFLLLEEAYSTIKYVIFSSVGSFKKEELLAIKKSYSIFILTSETKVPFINKYTSPKTLGTDRIALTSAAAVKYPNKNVLIIDAGSCITYDFINNKNQYLGGAISPGLKMRYKAVHSYTENLPLLDAIIPDTNIGDSTELSIHIGVVNGLLNEINEFISTYNRKYEDLTVILTGGDTDFLRDSLKNDIFANSNFLLEGLNYILEHNIHSC